MKKMTKITGSIAFIFLAILNIVTCVFYFEYVSSIYFEPGGTTRDAIEIMRTNAQSQ